MKTVISQLDVLSEDYPDKSIDQNSARLVNMYLEPGQVRSKGKYKIVAYPMPGYTQFANTLESNIRTMVEYNGSLYVVTGNKFGVISNLGVFTQLGSNLSTSSGFARIRVITGGSDINNQIMIIDGTNGYSYNLDTSVATFPISDVDFPQTAVDMTSQDDYILVADHSSIQYNLSNLADTLTWGALDFASKISYPDNLVGLESYKKRIFLHGNASTEVVYNSGNASFPFESVSDVFLNYGLVSATSKLVCKDIYYFLGVCEGGYGFYSVDPTFNPKPISSFVQETALQQMTTLSDCVAYKYAWDGHYFIDWVFPTENVTMTYDTTTGAWIEHQSGTSGRFIGNCAAACYGKVLIGDYNSGKIYYLSDNLYQDNGSDITRTIVTPPLYYNGRRIFLHRLQIDVETNVGANKSFTLEMSTDGGRTYSTIDTYVIPSDATTQIYTSSLGSAYDFRFRISSTMNAKFIVLGIIGHISVGNN